MMSKGIDSIKKIFFWLCIILFIVYMLFPFYWAVNSSLKTEAQLQMMPAALVPVEPETGRFAPTLANYWAVMSDKQFINGLINSTLISGVTTLIALCAGAFAGFALGKLRFKGKKITLYIILAMTMFPQVIVLAGLYAVINQLHLGARWSMILSYMLFTLPFTTWVLTSFFKDLPQEILSSAQIDGATPFQAFRLILLPLTAPALVTTGLLSFIAAWNEYLFALTFTSIEPDARTVPVVISLFSGTVARQEPFGEIMAAAVLVTIPVVALVLIFQRRIVAGLSSGAVKG